MNRWLLIVYTYQQIRIVSLYPAITDAQLLFFKSRDAGTFYDDHLPDYNRVNIYIFFIIFVQNKTSNIEDTKGMLDKIRYHDKIGIALNENCAIPLPDDVMRILTRPHRLSYYYFQYLEKGTATFRTDLTEFTINDGELAFGLPNQIFTKLPYDKNMPQYALSFDENTLTLLPGTYPFLVNPFNVHTI